MVLSLAVHPAGTPVILGLLAAAVENTKANSKSPSAVPNGNNPTGEALGPAALGFDVR